jgi:hypothetical protein
MIRCVSVYRPGVAIRRRGSVAAGALALVVSLLAAPAGAVGFRDAFNRPNGPIGPAYTEYKGRWIVRNEAALVRRAAPFSYATVRTGLSDDYRVDVDITLSPTRYRADAGIVTLYKDRDHHMLCKTEITRQHPGGFLSIGHFLPGDDQTALAYRTKVGVHNGRTYHMRFTRRHRRVACTLSGGDLTSPVIVRHELTAAERAAFGRARQTGLRARVARGEDDGESSWDNFSVTPLR